MPEWDALPWYEARIYMKGLIAESEDGEWPEDEDVDPVAASADELRALGLTVQGAEG